jgi:SARP family transcriptional regulator, regulator of embCAB operon
MLRIYLTGEISLTLGGELVRADRLPGRQGRRALAYLLVERHRPVTRDELADSLWPQHPPAAYEVALSAIVSKLRAVFDEAGLGRRVLTAESGCYRLELPAESWIDVEAAVESVHLAEAALLAANPRRAYGSAVVACAILRRPFLAGEEGAWVDARRDALRKARLRALDCLAQIHATTGELALALRAAEEAIDLEPFREAAYRRLMMIHDEAGNGAEALRVYRKLIGVLEAELSVTPGPETRRLFEEIARKSRSEPP